MHAVAYKPKQNPIPFSNTLSIMKSISIKLSMAIAALSGFVGCSTYQTTDLAISEYDATESRSDTGNGLLKPLNSMGCDSFPVESVIDDLKIIELNIPEGMERATKVIFGPDGDIFTMGESSVYRFSAQGDFMYRCGKAGRGEDEYITLEDIAIDGKSRTLLILDAMNKVLFFDYDSGKFIKSLTLNWRGKTLRSDAIFPNENDGGFYIFSAKLSQKNIDNNEYCIHQFNKNGVKIAQGLPCKDFVLDICPVTQSFDNRYMVNPVGGETTIWQAKNGDFEALYGVDFEGKGLKSKSRYNTNGEIDIHELAMSDSYKIIMNVADTRDYVSFTAIGAESKAYGYVFSKKNGRSICLTAPDGYAFPVRFSTSDEEYLYTLYTRRSMEDINERACPVSRYLADKLGIIPDGKIFLVGVRFDLES